MLKYQHSGSDAMPTTQKTISNVDSCGPAGTRLKMAGFDLTMNTMTAMPRIACTMRDNHFRSLSTDLSFVNIDITAVR